MLSGFRNIVAILLVVVSASAQAVTANVVDATTIARLYSAAFDRNPAIGGLNFWIDSYEAGRSIMSIAGDFYRSPEFTDRYGTLTDRQYVEQLFQNVLGRPGEEGGITFWTTHLANGVSRAKVLEQFAGSSENIAKTAETFSDMRLADGHWVFAPVANPQTELVKDVAPGTGGSVPWNLIDFKNRLYFTSSYDGMAALWRSDGTEQGTQVFKTFPQDWGSTGIHDPGAFAVAGERLFFRGNDYEHGDELWVSDGTAEGTVITRDILPGTERGLLSWPATWKGGVLFIADDGQSGRQFWFSDGTKAGTYRFEDAAVSTAARAFNFYPFKDGWLFKSTDAAHGSELWRTNGPPGDSELVKDIVPGAVGSLDSHTFSFAETTDAGVFWVWNANRVELWRTDGTAAGTSMFWVMPYSDAEPHYKLISYDDKVIFFLERSSRHWEMWCTDGTQAGTALVKGDLADEPSVRSVEYNGLLYLTLVTEAPPIGYQYKLWRTNCTSKGTQIAFELNPSSGGASPTNLTIYDGLLYFTADDGVLGEELYRTNGTSESIELVADIYPGEGSSEPEELTVSRGILFFRAYEPYNGTELYQTVNMP